jgi:hypothetical protein
MPTDKTVHIRNHRTTERSSQCHGLSRSEPHLEMKTGRAICCPRGKYAFQTLQPAEPVTLSGASYATERSVRSWADKARQARVERDKAIRAMHAEGASLRAIAAVAKMGHNSIAKIVKGDEEVSEMTTVVIS